MVDLIKYRQMSYEVRMKVIAEHIGNDITGLTDSASLFKLNEEGELRLYLNRLLSQEELDDLAVTIGKLKQDACVLPISFRYTNSTFGTIIEAIDTVIIPEDVMIGWQLLKEQKKGFPVWGWVILGAGLVVAYVEGRK